MELLPLILFAPFLLLAAISDMRFMRIPNYLVLCGVALFCASAVFLPLDSVLLRLAAAAMVFCIGFVGFALRMFGAGDVKMLAVLMLFVPPYTWPLFWLVFSVSMLLGIGFVLTLRSAPFAERSRMVSMRAKGMFPMGVAIALAGWLHPVALSLYTMAVS